MLKLISVYFRHRKSTCVLSDGIISHLKHNAQMSVHVVVTLQFVHYFCGMVFGKYLHNKMS